MYLVGFIVYVLICGALAWAIAVMITRRAKRRSTRWIAAALLLPIVLALPLADEIIGRYQFDRLCEKAKDVKIYGTIPVGEDLYTPDGKWRIGLQEGSPSSRAKEWKRAQEVLAKYIRLDLGSAMPHEVGAAIPIRRYDTKILNIKTGELLAEWQQFGTSGGWISRRFETPLIVSSQCMPDLVYMGQINQSILKFKRPEVAK